MFGEAAVGPCPGRRILVVDDYQDAAETLCRLLKMHGHEVRAARNGSEAIAAALAQRPEFVLLDLALPGMDGYQLAARLRREASCRQAVIIAVTGYGRPEDREQSRAAGINYHLLKPVDLTTLLSVLSQSERVDS
jgi:CheY-like chemotaxis protein